MIKINKNKQKGITLIGLVVTIIVLLILAGVSIMTLAGDNGLLNRTTSAKEKTTIAQFREEARIEYLAQQIDKHANSTAESYTNLINELKKKYTIRQPENASSQTPTITLSTNEGTIEEGGSITVDVDISYGDNDGEGGYYLLVDGKYYAITESSTNGLEVANEPTDIETGNEHQGNETIAASSSNTVAATATVSGKTITIEAAENTAANATSTITVTVDGQPFTNNTVSVSIVKLSTLDSINVGSTLTIDGASLITAKITDGTNTKIATSSDVKWSLKNPSDSNKLSVTSNGIVKCGTETGTATVVCTGANNTKAEVAVTSTANIVYTNSESANTTVTGATTGFAYNNPIIPVGFSAIDTANAKWNLSQDKTTATPQYNNGLVIMDEKGNQFVWVPVGETVTVGETTTTPIEYAKWCTTNIAYNNTNIGATDEMPANTTDTTTDYGGFWIGRFEAGLDVDMVDSNGVSTAQTDASTGYRSVDNNKSIPIIVEGAIPWNRISYTNSKANAEKVYTSTTYAQSGLINGTQWDTALKFIQEKGGKTVTASTDWGNHYDSLITSLNRYPLYSTDYGASWSAESSKAANTSHLLRTGASTQTQVLNISDMAGNLWEWTTEVYSTSNRVIRGGGCNDNGTSSLIPAAYRTDLAPSFTGNNTRFPCGALHKVKLITDKGGLSSQ